MNRFYYGPTKPGKEPAIAQVIIEDDINIAAGEGMIPKAVKIESEVSEAEQSKDQGTEIVTSPIAAKATTIRSGRESRLPA